MSHLIVNGYQNFIKERHKPQASCRSVTASHGIIDVVTASHGIIDVVTASHGIIDVACFSKILTFGYAYFAAV
jgi:hypothetical protein